MSAAAIWHDVECGSYSADLALWEELAAAAEGPVLELGCGTGRVALHLARRGHRVIGLDLDPELIASLRERAEGLPLRGVVADARDFRLETELTLALAPMQMLQLLPDAAARIECLRSVSSRLSLGARFVAAIVERMPEPDGSPPPLPDVRDVDGWVYSSLPIEAEVGGEEIVVRRLRQTVSPRGELSEERNEIRIQTLSADALEAEGREAGLAPAGRRAIPMTDLHVGSTAVVLAKES